MTLYVKRLFSSFIFTIISVGIWGVIIAIIWVFLKEGSISVSEYQNLIIENSIQGNSISTLSDTVSASLDYSCDGSTSCIHSQGYIHYDSSVYLISLGVFTIVGWILLVIYGGIGIVLLPCMCVNQYIHRPRAISIDEYKKKNQEYSLRINEMKTICLFMKDICIYDLEKKVTTLQESYIYKQSINVMKPILYLIAGIVSICLSLLLYIHMGLYTIPLYFNKTPLSLFLNSLFIFFSDYVPFLATFSVCILIGYLLLCTITGIFQFGLKFTFVSIHEMRKGDTLMNSFLFNEILILLVSPAIIHFSIINYQVYFHNSSIITLFSTLSSLNILGYIFKYSYCIWGMIIVTILTIISISLSPLIKMIKRIRNQQKEVERERMRVINERLSWFARWKKKRNSQKQPKLSEYMKIKENYRKCLAYTRSQGVIPESKRIYKQVPDEEDILVINI
ncbi:hypothetical protein WA158_002773 [Blastocystis sp. Blastoise]